MRLFAVFASAATILGFAITPASAALMNYSINFATDPVFHDMGPGPDLGSVTGSISLIFDPTYSDPTNSVSLDSFSLGSGFPGSTLLFSYPFVPSHYSDALAIGGAANSIDGTAPGQNDIELLITNFTTAPKLVYFSVTDTNFNHYGAVGGSVSVSASAVSATPLPAALPLFASGLGGLGLVGWCKRRRKGARPAAA